MEDIIIQLQTEMQLQKQQYENTIGSLKKQNKKEVEYLKIIIKRMRQNSEQNIKITNNIR